MILNIQILRGISVLLVVFYHLEFSSFYFGYLGVDVFFIISGYLMPVILPKYTAISFLRARVMRLAPALICMIFVCLVVGFFIQMPGEYKNTAESAISSLLNISFIYFDKNTGYFDVEAGMQLLLHTWSLGNEVVGYLCLFAILLCITNKRSAIYPTALLIAIIIALSVILAPSSSYFDPVPRLYLFFAGLSGSYWFANKKLKKHANTQLAFSLIVGIVFWFLYSDLIQLKAWPNTGIILLPFIIVPLLALEKPLLTGPLAKCIIFIGTISYSMYIWHWPIIVLEKTYLRNINIGTKEAFFLLIIILAASIFSYYLIEIKSKLLSVKHMLISSLAVLIISVVVVATNGASIRVPDGFEKYSSVERMRSSACSIEDSWCKLGHPEIVEDKRLLVVGDSHARHFLNLLVNRYEGLTYYNLPLSNLLITTADTLNFGKASKLFAEYETVIFAYKWSEKTVEGVDALFDLIATDQTSRLVFVRDVPSYEIDPVACLLARHSLLKYRSCDFDPMDGILLRNVSNGKSPIWPYVLSQIGGSYKILDTHMSMCDETRCIGSIDGEFLMRDKHHLNENLSPKPLAKLSARIFGEL